MGFVAITVYGGGYNPFEYIEMTPYRLSGQFVGQRSENGFCGPIIKVREAPRANLGQEIGV
jgi:hypothetical protein